MNKEPMNKREKDPENSFRINCRYNNKPQKDGKCYSTECMMNQHKDIAEAIKKNGCRAWRWFGQGRVAKLFRIKKMVNGKVEIWKLYKGEEDYKIAECDESFYSELVECMTGDRFELRGFDKKS